MRWLLVREKIGPIFSRSCLRQKIGRVRWLSPRKIGPSLRLFLGAPYDKTSLRVRWALKCFFSSESHVTLDRNPGPGYDTLLLRLILGNLLSACPHSQFHTLPDLLDSQAALSNSYPNACGPMQGGNLYHFYDGLWWLQTTNSSASRFCSIRLHQGETRWRNVIGCYCDKNI